MAKQHRKNEGEEAPDFLPGEKSHLNGQGDMDVEKCHTLPLRTETWVTGD